MSSETHECSILERDDGVVVIACETCGWVRNVSERKFAPALIESHRLLHWDWPFEDDLKLDDWVPQRKGG